MKKQYMNYMKSCLLVVIACFVSMVGAAQGFSPAAMEQLKTKRLWSHSQNAAGMPCLLYTSPSPRDRTRSRMPSSA